MGEQEYVQTIFTEDAPQPGDYSQAKKIFVGNGWFVYTAAVGPDPAAKENKDGSVEKLSSPDEELAGYVGPLDIQNQTKKTLSNLEAVLKEAGAEAKDIVKINVVLAKGHYTSMDNLFSKFGSVYKYYFERAGVENLPSRALTFINEFPWQGYLILMDAVAFVPNERMEKTLQKLKDIESGK